jgi:hypothetical protein
MMRLKLIAFVLVAMAGTVMAQEPSMPGPAERQRPITSPVTNEDGGRAFTLEQSSAPLNEGANPGSLIVAELQQHSIFLGRGWASPALTAREARLSNLLANIQDQTQLNEIDAAGIKNRFAPTSRLEKLDLGDGNITDLEIQSLLAEMFKDGTLPEPRPGAIYTVFLDRGLNSTLGSLVAGKHYSAYHGFVNVSGARIHYAVIPFQPDSKTAYQIALRTLVTAALNPTGSTSN